MRGLRAVPLAAATVLAVAACSPAPPTPDAIVLAFIAASQDAARTMHVEWHGIIRNPPNDVDPEETVLTSTAAFDFNGPDYMGTLLTEFSFSDSTSSQSFALVAGVSFVKLGDHGDSVWMRTLQDGERSPQMDPLHGLTVADVAYDSLGTLGGRPVHLLRVVDPLAAFSGDWLPQLNRAVESRPSEHVIFVDDEGIPVGAHVEFDLTRNMIINGEESDTTESHVIQIDYVFSKWGEPVTITAPELTGDPRATATP